MKFCFFYYFRYIFMVEGKINIGFIFLIYQRVEYYWLVWEYFLMGFFNGFVFLKGLFLILFRLQFNGGDGGGLRVLFRGSFFLEGNISVINYK